MKTTTLGIALLSLTVLPMTSCKKKGCTDPDASNYDSKAKKNDNSCIYPSSTTDNEVVQGRITQNTTWVNTKIYELKGKVVVENGATLTIQAGTIIKGQEGSGANASALVIAKGAKIMAEGTSSQPIIFTSVLDNIELGKLSGTNLDVTDNSKWGGLIILGNAPISAGNGDTETQIEGIPATETYGAFGGNNPNDNSGVLNYISIRHGGALIGAGNEINGLTLGGVGSGTSISNIEILATLDDGVEFFGGTVNITNLVVGYQGDDGIDIDMNYAGTINNFAVVHGGSTDEGLEIDGPEGTTNIAGMFTLENGTIKSEDGRGSGSDFKSKAQGTLNNVTWEGYNMVVKIRASYSDTTSCTDKEDAYSHLSSANPTLLINNSEIISSATISSLLDVYTKSYVVSSNDICTASAKQTALNILTSSGVTVSPTKSISGANLSSFSWTWLASHNKL